MNKKIIYAYVLSLITSVSGIDFAKQFDALFRDHKKLNLKNPKTLSEKVSYIELHEQLPLAARCTDKFEVRKYVASKGLKDILVPIFGGAYTSFGQLDISQLPERFVIKATHGCKMNYLVPNKAQFNSIQCQKEVERWMNTTYGTYSMEPHYLKIPHRFYVEKYLDKADQLIDYKFHCLNGIPQFVLTCSERQSDGDKAMKVTLDLFDINWNPIQELISSGLECAGNGRVPKPRNLNRMIGIAKILSADFKFVRVDLYELDGKIYFGELTFSPAHCTFPYFSKKFDLEMGKLLQI